MTSVDKRHAAAQSRKAARILMAQAREHAKKARALERMAERELSRAKAADKRARELARVEAKAKRKKPAKGKRASKASRPRGKHVVVWQANNGSGWSKVAELGTLEQGRAMVRRLRASHKGTSKLALVLRPSGDGPPPWPAPPSSRK